ncbi:MAG: hypothetical protein HEP71_20315 [Roseivirga sp.]|nr:hypothetical protein [Roseivirga sp.]
MRAIRQNLALALVLIVFSGLAGCSGDSGGEVLADTVQLESGVEYIYLKRGSGLKVDTGSHVTTHINLIVGQDTIWSTYAEGEEQFEFDAKKTSLIKGFDEVVMYAREGDRLLAIIPPELGYGEEGAGDVVPPNATLKFDLDFLKVEEPRIFLSDVLYDKLKAEGAEAALAEYQTFKYDSINYNISNREWFVLHRKIMRDSAYQDAIVIWEARLAERPDLNGYYNMATAYDSLGQQDEALRVLETSLTSGADTTGSGFIKRYIDRLKSK